MIISKDPKNGTMSDEVDRSVAELAIWPECEPRRQIREKA